MIPTLRLSLLLASLAASTTAHPVASDAAPLVHHTRQEAQRFSFFPLQTPLAGPCDLVRGPDDALWGQGILANIIFRIDPVTGATDEYTIPFTVPADNQTIPGVPDLVGQRGALSCAIRGGADGKLYAANGIRTQLVQIDPATRAMKVFQPPATVAGNLQPFNDLYTSDDGMWSTQTTGNVLQRFDYATETFETFRVPTPLALPLGLYVASDGVVYVAELLANQILTLDPATGRVEEWPLPEALLFPAVIRAERSGWVYFSLFIGNGIGRINMETHEIEIFHTDQLAGIGAEDTIDRAGGVWYSFFDVNKLARLDTDTFQFSYVQFPGTLLGGLNPNGVLSDVLPAVDVAVNYGPGDAVWFTDVPKNRVGRYRIDGQFGPPAEGVRISM